MGIPAGDRVRRGELYIMTVVSYGSPRFPWMPVRVPAGPYKKTHIVLVGFCGYPLFPAGACG